MSYILYINGKRIELSDSKPLAQTKQVNDLGKLSSKQTNFTNKFIAPPTASNVRALDKVGLVGNQSNLPYKKNVVDLFDADTGDCLIYKGWGNITGTSDKGYEIYVYDGNIDFYKAIEKLTLTDVGISGLNHVKNLTNVIDSFSGDLNYMYIIADYNGKNKTENNALNIDYQLPSAKTSYLWERIFDFIGMTFTGAVFESPKFLNHWMTYPKPVPTLEPIVNPITSQESKLEVIWNVDLTFSYHLSFFPNNFDTVNADNNSNVEIVSIKTDGTYRLKVEGVYYVDGVANGMVNWTLTNNVGVIKSSGSVNGAINGSTIISASAGDKLYLSNAGFINESYSGSIQTTFDYVLGYDANFEEALVDFKVKDYVNEIMQEFGLTMFKDKYTNNVDFRKLKEILQSEVIHDWSDKFKGKASEKYIFSNYAQKNLFKYRYNDENVDYNDGFISVNNENLIDETPIINSKIYSPEKIKVSMFELQLNTYKFWNKEIKDDSTIEYKELTGRYYFLRAEPHTYGAPILIGSDALNTETSISVIQREDYSRLSWQEIIYDNYGELESILDKAKTLEANFDLKTKDVANFTFKDLIYVDKLASYYLVNKIPNFIKGNLTKCELIEVDYLKTIAPPVVIVPTILQITSVEVSGCQITITYDTDADPSVPINVIGQPNSFGTIPPPVLGPERYYDSVVYASGPTGNTAIITVLAGGYWAFNLKINEFNLISNTEYFENEATCNYEPPFSGSYITITSIETLSVIGVKRRIRIYYESDLPGNNVIHMSGTPDNAYAYPESDTWYLAPSSGWVETEVVDKWFSGPAIVWSVKLYNDNYTIISNTVNS